MSSRRHKTAPNGQRGFRFSADVAGSRVPPQKDNVPKVQLPMFEAPDPYALSINGQPLSDYLKQMGQSWVVELVDLLCSLDWRIFFSSYKLTGRPPIHPRVLLGLSVYGLLTGRTALRELETLASLDLGAWFVCGGVQPDHSTVGKFFHRHCDILTEDFFKELTVYLLSRLKLGPGMEAIDGTVIAAVSSGLSTMKLTAVREAAKEAAAKADALEKAHAPQNTPPATPCEPTETKLSAEDSPPSQPSAAPSPSALSEAQERAAVAAKILEVAETRAAKAENPERAAVVPGELEAVIQPLKHGGRVPAYKPSIGVHESGLIVGQTVEPSSEVAAVPSLREQHRQIFGADPTTTLFDAGYHCREILQSFADQDILCPAGTVGQDFVRRGRGGMFGKASFVYDAHTDSYRCPGGQTLARITNRLEGPNGPYANYGAASGCCAKCPLKASCTKAKARTVTRWEADDLKEAMAEVMAQPRARAVFARRKAIVEPVFADLKERQRLRRFRRRGLKNVRMEFALHCIAFNLGRALSIERRRQSVVVVVVLVWARLEGAQWRLMAIRSWLQ